MADQAARLRELVAAVPAPDRSAGPATPLEPAGGATALVIGARAGVGCSTVADGIAAAVPGADLRVVDGGAGRDAVQVAAALGPDLVCVVTTPDVPAVLAAYASCKAIALAGLDSRVGIVVNRARSHAEATAVAGRVVGVARRFLGVAVDALGHVPTDCALQRDDATVAPPAPAPRGVSARAFAQLARACGVRPRAELERQAAEGFAFEEGT
jgi:MinD-like ATPase involved in chromosome partitioning or flagellar assembly